MTSISSASPPRILLAGAAARPGGDFERFLLERGWKWEFVDHKEALIEALKRNSFDLLVLDAALPRVNLDEIRSAVPVEDGGRHLALLVVNSQGRKDVFQGQSGLHVRKCEGHVELPVLERLAVLSSRRRQCPGSGEGCRREIVTITAGEAQKGLPEIPLLDHLCRMGWINESVRQRIILAFQEAFTNSLEHGSLELSSIWKDELDEEGRDLYASRRHERLSDPAFADRNITVVGECDCLSLTIKIIDQGPGFSLNHACEEIMQRSAMSFHGRGLAIIGSIMDEVSFSEDGTEIVMRKDLDY